MGKASGPAQRRVPRSSTAVWWGEFSTFWLWHPVRRVTFVGLCCALALSAFGTQHFRVHKELASPHKVLGISAETVYLPPLPALRMASLGNQSFAADLLFIRVAHYFVDHLLSDSQMPYIDLYLNAIWGLDAHNRTTYRWGAQVIKFGQRIDESVNARANNFARRGLAYFPADPWLYQEIAYNLFAYKHLYDEVERNRCEALALRYLELAYKMPGFDFDPNYLAHLYERAGNIDSAVTASMSSYAMGSIEQRRELRLRLVARDHAAAAAQLAWLDRAHGRDWPWLSEDLAMFVGPKRIATPPLDGARPENWLTEPPTPDEVLKQLALTLVEPIGAMVDPGTKRDPNEWHRPVGAPWREPSGLPEAVTEDKDTLPLLPKQREELPAAMAAVERL